VKFIIQRYNIISSLRASLRFQFTRMPLFRSIPQIFHMFQIPPIIKYKNMTKYLSHFDIWLLMPNIHQSTANYYKNKHKNFFLTPVCCVSLLCHVSHKNAASVGDFRTILYIVIRKRKATISRTNSRYFCLFETKRLQCVIISILVYGKVLWVTNSFSPMFSLLFVHCTWLYIKGI